jgi:hypothetical protein
VSKVPDVRLLAEVAESLGLDLKLLLLLRSPNATLVSTVSHTHYSATLADAATM